MPNYTAADFLRMLPGRAQSGSGGGFRYGDVTAAGHGQLIISAGGYALTPEDLILNPLYDYRWEEDTGGDYLLRAGDRVALLTDDGQVFYLLGKAAPA